MVTIVAISAICASCDGIPAARRFSTNIHVIDEAGQPIRDARIDVGWAVLTPDDDGYVGVKRLNGPLLATVEAPGYLADSVILGREDEGRTVPIRLISNAGGRRWVMHNGGDTMLGRRYEKPREGAPILPADGIAHAAEELVAPLARAFSLADVSTLNLESAVTSLPSTAAEAGQPFPLATKPEALVALRALGTDIAVMANNHSRDFGDSGITATMAALAAHDIQSVGAAPAAETSAATAADRPLILDMGGVRVGFLAWSSVSGDTANNRLPQDGQPAPDSLESDDDDAWKYEPRRWGYEGPTWTAPSALRRAGSAWRLFADAEPTMPADEAAAAWASLKETYPELQDLVQRRGHGGAAYFTTEVAREAITALRPQVDLIVVQVHGGYTFETIPSSYSRRAARTAVDAGADLVLCHGPYVLSGAEWYRDRLIAYGLGNLLFDNDRFETFSTAYLRTVWEGADLIEARFVLFELDRYRPFPVTDAGARRTALAIWERSATGLEATRDKGGNIRVYDAGPHPEAVAARVLMRNHDAVLVPPAQAHPAHAMAVRAAEGETVDLGQFGLVDPGQSSGDGVLLGRDLLGWGDFEDQIADDARINTTHWRFNSDSEDVEIADSAGRGIGFVRLQRSGHHDESVVVQPASRLSLPAHNIYRQDPLNQDEWVGADGAPSYALRFLARSGGSGASTLWLDLYHGDGSSGDVAQTLEYTIDFADSGAATVYRYTADGVLDQVVTTTGNEAVGYTGDNTDPHADADADADADAAADGWHRFEFDIDIPEAVIAESEGRISLGLRFDPPASGTAYLDLDDIALIEWRALAELPPLPGAYRFMRNPGSAPTEAQLHYLPLMVDGLSPVEWQ